MKPIIRNTSAQPSISNHYLYSLINDVLFSWLRFYKATDQSYTRIKQHQYFYQKTIDIHHIAYQVPVFEKALLAKKTTLKIGQLSFLIYVAFKHQRFSEKDLSNWQVLGEVEEADSCLGFWLGHFLSLNQCHKLPSELWISQVSWIRRGVIKGLFGAGLLDEAWVNLGLQDNDESVIAEVLRAASSLNIQLDSIYLEREYQINNTDYERVRARVLTGLPVAPEDYPVLISQMDKKPESISLLLFSMPDYERYEWLLKNREVLGYRPFLLGLSLCGNVKCVPILIELLNSENLNRLATQSFSTFTGFDLSNPNNILQNWQGSVDKTYSKKDRRIDDAYVWGDISEIANWWEINKNRFVEDVFYLQGSLLEESCEQDMLPVSLLNYVAHFIRISQRIHSHRRIFDWSLCAQVNAL